MPKQLPDQAPISLASAPLTSPAAPTSTKLMSPAAPTSSHLAPTGPQRNILAIVAILLAVGLVMVYSTSAIVAQLTKAGDPYFFIKKQAMWTLLAIAAMLTMMDFPYQKLQRYAPVIFSGMLLVLLATLIPGIGTKYNGARRWLRFAGLGFQPSDLAKLTTVIFVAAYVAHHGRRIRLFTIGLLPIVAAVGATCFLILIEPDFGTSTFIMLVSLGLLIAGGIRLRHLLPLFLAALPVVLLLAIYKFHHIRARLLIYFHPECDRLGKGHQITQSLIAIGSGGLWGQGLGQGKQKLFFLPEETTDFIFAIFCEELGFLGASILILLFAMLIYQGLQVVKRTPDIFGALLALGITMIIGLQAVFNIAVVTATIPAKGISLPFISFGGSGLFVTLLGVGILLNVAGACHNVPERVCQPPVATPVPLRLKCAQLLQQLAGQCRCLFVKLITLKEGFRMTTQGHENVVRFFLNSMHKRQAHQPEDVPFSPLSKIIRARNRLVNLRSRH